MLVVCSDVWMPQRHCVPVPRRDTAEVKQRRSLLAFPVCYNTTQWRWSRRQHSALNCSIVSYRSRLPGGGCTYVYLERCVFVVRTKTSLQSFRRNVKTTPFQADLILITFLPCFISSVFTLTASVFHSMLHIP